MARGRLEAGRPRVVPHGLLPGPGSTRSIGMRQAWWLGTAANPLDDPADAAALAGYAAAAGGRVVAALPGWVERSVAERCRPWRARSAGGAGRSAARPRRRRARPTSSPALRALLATDVGRAAHEPARDPARAAARTPPTCCAAAGVPAVVRDEHAERLFPDDDYDLGPAAFADLDPDGARAPASSGAPPRPTSSSRVVAPTERR